jgi:tetratricopeptide (TPR) repeat protein
MVAVDVGGTRYHLLETVREYALLRLDEAGDGVATRERHLVHFLTLAEAASSQLAGPEQGQWLERLDPEQENFLAAHAWCDEAQNGAEAGLRLMFALKLYLFNRGLLAPMRWGLTDALARPGAEARTVFRCRALHTAGQVESLMGNFAQAQTHLQQALEIAHELGDTARAAMVLEALGSTCTGQGDRTAARGYLEQGLALARQRGERRGLAAALNTLAQLHRLEGALDAAEPLYEQGLALTVQLGDREGTAVALLNLAMVAIGRGLHEHASTLLIEALDLAEAVGSKPTGGFVFAVSTSLAALREDWTQASWFFGAAESQMKQTGIRLDATDEAFLAPWVTRARQALAPDQFKAAQHDASALPYEQAIAAAREWLEAGMS